MSVRKRTIVAALATAVVATSLIVPATAASAQNTVQPAPTTMPIQLLALNDFHGNLEPPQGSSGNITRINPDGTTSTILAGGVEYLATQLKNARVDNPNSLTVAAGDLIGATPLLSAGFHDEPTIEAMNKIGLDVSSVGNHEFDEGWKELLRMQKGGCHPVDGCYDPANPFQGADFPFLAANVVHDRSQLPILPPIWLEYVNGAIIGFIGMTLEGTPNIVTAAGIQGITFKDEVETANKYAKLFKLVGVNAIVTLIHEGGIPANGAYNNNCNTPTPGAGVSGPIVDIAKNLDPAIDVIVSGHTHAPYVCSIDDPAGQPRLVTSASSFGRLFTEIKGDYNKATRDFVRASMTAQNRVVTRDVPKDAELTALVDKYRVAIAPIANRVIGHIGATITRTPPVPATGESALGDLIADAQLASTSSATTGAAVVAFMNPGGIRTDLAYPSSAVGEGDGVVTYGEAFAVQPFNNVLTTMTLTGAQIVTLLQQQYSGPNLAAPKVLQVSQGFAYSVNPAATGAAKIVVDSITINGVALDPAASYRVTVNNFLAGGGDGFSVLISGTNLLVGDLDIDSFEDYLTANSSPSTPYPVPAANRISVAS